MLVLPICSSSSSAGCVQGAWGCCVTPAADQQSPDAAGPDRCSGLFLANSPCLQAAQSGEKARQLLRHQQLSTAAVCMMGKPTWVLNTGQINMAAAAANTQLLMHLFVPLLFLLLLLSRSVVLRGSAWGWPTHPTGRPTCVGSSSSSSSSSSSGDRRRDTAATAAQSVWVCMCM
jgi:hypothetical protein